MIPDPTREAQPAELPQVAAAREFDAAARARLRTGRPEPDEAEWMRRPGGWSA